MNPEEQLAASNAQPFDASQQMNEQPAPQDPMEQMAMEGQPMEGMDPNVIGMDQGMGMMDMENMGAPDPMDALPMTILDYLDFASQTKYNQELAEPVKAQIMLQMAQALNYLVPMLPKKDPQAEQDFQLKIAEFQMSQQEKQMDMQFKQQAHELDMQMKQEEMKFKQAEQQMNLQFKQQENQLKAQTAEVQNQQKIVHSQQQHETKLEQAKQAAQSKQSSKPSNGEGK